jgi:hypothetical protein
MRICKAEAGKNRTVRRVRGRLTEITGNYSCTPHQRKTKAVPQAMQAAIEELRWKALLSGKEIASEKNGHLLNSHITEPPTMNGPENCSFLVALRSGTGQYAPLQSILFDPNYRQDNAQVNVQGNSKKDDVQGNSKEDDVLGNAKEDDA